MPRAPRVAADLSPGAAPRRARTPSGPAEQACGKEPGAPGSAALRLPGVRYGVLDELAGYALRRAQIALYEDFERATAGLELSPQRFAALVLIDANPGLRQGLLGDAMGIARSGALRLADWLQARGLVAREPDPADSRVWGLRLTPAGRALLARAARAVRAHDAALLAALGEQGAGLKSTLERLAAIASKAAG